MKRVVKADITTVNFAIKLFTEVESQTVDDKARERIHLHIERLYGIKRILTEASSQGIFAYHRRVI